MSYDLTSPVFRINFTDGTYCCVLNSSEYAKTYSWPAQYEEIVPALFISNISGSDSEPVIKTDLDGNVWEICNDYIKINGVSHTRDNSQFLYLEYNPVTNKFRSVWLWGLTIPSMSDYNHGPHRTYAVDGTVYMRDTSGTDFSSFGAALYAAEYAYDHSPVGGTAVYYTLNNITDKSTRIQMHGINIYKGNANPYGTPLHFRDFIRGNKSYSEYYDIDFDDSLGDFKPDIEDIASNDPFEPGGDSSGTDPGGNGNFDDTSEPVDIPNVPSLSASDTGFITLYNPSLSELKNLASYMWTGLFDIDNFRKIFANPMDCILGLSIVPVAVPNGSSKEVTVGNIGTGINMTTAASQYVQVDCGSLNVNEFWGAYLDYEPYTKAEIYLPYIGTHPIAVDDIMGKTVNVKYTVDILSGACTAFVKCGESVLYEFIGQCSSSIPICGNDWTNVINGAINIASSIGTMVATGGLSAPIQIGQAEAGAISAKAVISGGQQIASTAVNSMKPSIEKSGAIGSTGGMLAVQTPYLILTRPRQALPRSQNSFTGYPSFKTCYLSELSGYTEVEKIHLENVPATDDEIVEIANLLARGVIL